MTVSLADACLVKDKTEEAPYMCTAFMVNTGIKQLSCRNKNYRNNIAISSIFAIYNYLSRILASTQQ